jgi:hypothetical protein
VKSGAEGWSRSRPRSLAAVFGLQLCLAFIGPDCLARFGGDQHIGRFNADADQLDWLISITAMIVLFWSRATRDLLKACPGAGRGRSAGASRHSIGYMQRRSCHFRAARPIASLGPASRRGASRLVATPASITSPPIKTIGIAPFAARIARVKGLVAATITSGFRLTTSRARSP